MISKVFEASADSVETDYDHDMSILEKKSRSDLFRTNFFVPFNFQILKTVFGTSTAEATVQYKSQIFGLKGSIENSLVFSIAVQKRKLCNMASHCLSTVVIAIVGFAYRLHTTLLEKRALLQL